MRANGSAEVGEILFNKKLCCCSGRLEWSRALALRLAPRVTMQTAMEAIVEAWRGNAALQEEKEQIDDGPSRF